jgi:hypothetical protein
MSDHFTLSLCNGAEIPTEVTIGKISKSYLKIYLALHLGMSYLKIYLNQGVRKTCVDIVNLTARNGVPADIIGAASAASALAGGMVLAAAWATRT